MFALSAPAHRACRPVALLASLLLVTAACDKRSAAPVQPQEQPQPAAQPDPPTTHGAEIEPEPEPSAPAVVDPAAEDSGASGDAGSDAGDAGDADGPVASAEAATKPKDKDKAKEDKAKPGLPSPIFGKGDSSCGRDPGVGQPIKSFSLETTTGKTISSAQLKGRVVLLNFWGTWCKPCLKELPEFDRLYRRYRKSGLVLLAIATDSDPEPVAALAKERRLAAKIAIGGEELANSYKSPSFPFSFVVDENGIIQASYRGFKPECLGQLEQDIRRQLAAE